MNITIKNIGKQIKSLDEVGKYASLKRAFIGKSIWFYDNNKKPKHLSASYVFNMSGACIDKMIKQGLYLYERSYR